MREGGRLGPIGQSQYVLLIPQSHGNHYEEAKKTETSKYHQRIKHLKSQLSGKNKIHAINMYTLPVIRYLGYPVSIVS